MFSWRICTPQISFLKIVLLDPDDFTQHIWGMNISPISKLFSYKKAIYLAVLVSASLLISVFAIQYIGQLAPCSLCLTQRWPHGIALALGLLAMMPIIGAPARRFLLIMISIAFATTAGIGAYHAGIEYGWFIGPTTCSGNIDGNTIDELKRQLLAQPVVRCDEVTWSLLGISLAGYNFFISSALSIICGISLFVGAKDFRS